MSTISLKYSDLISQYSGEGDFVEWLDKFELVVKLQDVKQPEKFLPLFLTAGAFAVYQSLSGDTKKDYDLVKSALTKAFSSNSFNAYEQLRNRRLKPGESVDCFAAELSRLVGLVSAAPDMGLLKCAFVCGLPETVQTQIQASCLLASMSLPDIVEKARSLVSCRDEGHLCLVSGHNSFRGQSGGRNFRRRQKCYESNVGVRITCCVIAQKREVTVVDAFVTFAARRTT